jgi:hypothetical protein
LGCSLATSVSRKVSKSIPSKHLLRCRCTARGSRACARICSSSSLERK